MGELGVAIIARRKGFAAAPVAFILWFAAPAFAEEVSSNRQEFIDRYHCEITTRLSVIRDTQALKNRFIVVAPADAPGNYVQCLFTDGGAAILCEAASGYHAVPEGTNWTHLVSVEGREALNRLGFLTEINQGNYTQRIAIRKGEDLDRVASIILGTLFDAYEVRLGRDLKVKAPLADLKGLMSPTCTPTN